MRSARAAVHAALPLLGLAGLAVLSAVGTAAPNPVLTRGSGTVAPTVVVRIVTDGHPQLITLPVPRTSLVLPAPLPPSRSVTRAAARTATRVVLRPKPVTGTAPRPAPTAVRRAATAPDEYPYASDGSDGTDPWGFTMRQCVSYVAWQLSDAGRPIDNASQGWGSALDWDETATRLGYAVSERPTVGSVAQWNANEASPYWAAGSSGTFVAGTMGHVAWVTRVYSDGSVLVAQYNGTGDRTYSTMRVKAPRYLSL